jgi:hypothetical protein
MSPATTIDLAEMTVSLLGGLLLEDGSRVDHVGLRRVSGREEDWLARHPTASNAEAVSALLSACIEQESVDMPARLLTRQMLVGDRDYLMVQLRALTLGTDVVAVYSCPACHQKMDVLLDLTEVPAEPAPQIDLIHEIELSESRRVRFRLPNGADQEAVARLPLDHPADVLIARCLVDDDGTPLDEDDKQRISEAMERLSPKVEIELELTCPECAHVFATELDVASFFFAELAASHQTLLREVHHLAFYYGWSEEAILAMDRDRRRAYLSLLSDELAQD